MHNALHVLEIGLTVLSIGHIIKAGYTMQFEARLCKIKKGGSIIGSIPVNMNGLFKVEHTPTSSAAMAPTYADVLTLHHRLGHLSADSICTLICSNAVSGLHIIDNFLPFTYDSCEYTKVMRQPICKGCEAPLADCFSVEVHSDVWGHHQHLALEVVSIILLLLMTPHATLGFKLSGLQMRLSVLIRSFVRYYTLLK